MHNSKCAVLEFDFGFAEYYFLHFFIVQILLSIFVGNIM